MRKFGFSTGALAKGDFHRGIALQKGLATAIELSALREDELDAILAELPNLDLASFDYVSLHAPSRLQQMSEQDLVTRLAAAAKHVHFIVVHPDVIESVGRWTAIAPSLAIENMDQRKPVGRTCGELERFFEQLPAAKFCFDIAHAHQVDPTLGAGLEMLLAFQSRLVEVHVSEVDVDSSHAHISSAARFSYSDLSCLIAEEIPIIVESMIPPAAMREELLMAQAAFGE